MKSDWFKKKEYDLDFDRIYVIKMTFPYGTCEYAFSIIDYNSWYFFEAESSAFVVLIFLHGVRKTSQGCVISARGA